MDSERSDTSRALSDVGDQAEELAGWASGKPAFTVDASWPEIPNGSALGQVSTVSVDHAGNIWVLHRPNTAPDGYRRMPPVIQFSQAGSLLQAWGGGADGYDWPAQEHGIFADTEGYVWICGSGDDDQVLKFTTDGKFVLQIGNRSLKAGNTETRRFGKPTGFAVWPKSNELLVSDGYVNQRVMVFAADTGEYKRMWGAFGKRWGNPESADRSDTQKYVDDPPEDQEADVGALEFHAVHDVAVANDGLVYVADRGGQRVQVFTLDGEYKGQAWVDRWCPISSGQTASGIAFSPDPQQRYMYVASRSASQILIFDRSSLRQLGAFGKAGAKVGEFSYPHGLACDQTGAIYVSEVGEGRRVQRFVLARALPSAS